LERGLDPLDVFDWNPKRPPYPGLMAFQEQDAAIFFGRGEDILKTLETLDALRRQGREAARFALLLGASGSGKSSLARAGVIPRLKKKPAEWLPAPPFRPLGEPLDELAMALAAAFESHGRPRDRSAIQAELHAAAARIPVDRLALLGLARDLAIAARQPETTVLLTIDQAEELFGYSPPEAATRFLRLLRATLEASDRQLMAVATLRSDFLGEFQNHPVLQDNEYPHHFRYQAVPVDPMPLRNFPAIIQGPARLAGVRLDDGLVEAMVNDTGTCDALPLLAFTLRRLYERHGGDGRLSVGEYESLGRLEGAVREEAQRVIAETNPTPEDLETLHAAFVPTMVRINAEGGYARRRALFGDLPRRALPLLRRFVDARLLVSDRDSGGRETIKVAHEALLRTWPQLSVWLAEDRDKLRLLESIQRSAEEWEQGGQRDDLLIHRDGRLKDAEALLANPRFAVPEGSPERAYLNACGTAQQAREAAEKEEQEQQIRDAERIAEEQKKAAEEQKKAALAQQRTARNTRIGLVAALVLATLAGTTAVVAYNEKQAAQRALADADYREAWGKLGLGRVDESLPLLAHALRTDAAYLPGQGLLLDLLERRNWPLPLTEPLRHEDGVASAQFSPDGTRVVTASWDTTARVWDAKTGKALTEPLRHEEVVASAQFSPDGTRVVTASEDTTARVWDAKTGKALTEPLRHKAWVLSAQFSPDGTRVVTASKDTTARVWDVKTGKALTEPLRHEEVVASAQFSLDGTRVVTASEDTTARVWDAKTGKALTEPLRHEGGVLSAQFSPDGTRVVTASKDTTARVWDVPTMSASDAELVASLAEAVAGYRVSEQDLVVPVIDLVDRFAQLREKTANATVADGMGRWFVRWFLANRWNRTISPLSSVTVQEYIQRRIAEGRIEDAVFLFSGHPFLTETGNFQGHPSQTLRERMLAPEASNAERATPNSSQTSVQAPSPDGQRSARQSVGGEPLPLNVGKPALPGQPPRARHSPSPQ
jgi:hypothetical protein